MALSSIAVPPDAKRDARARELVPFVASWPKHTLKVAFESFEVGTTFRRAPGSHGARYLVNSVACECPDYQQSHNICKHIRAIVLWEQKQRVSAALAAYEAQFCAEPGCRNDAARCSRFCEAHWLVDAF